MTALKSNILTCCLGILAILSWSCSSPKKETQISKPSVDTIQISAPQIEHKKPAPEYVGPNPVTQYLIVEVSENGNGVYFRHNIEQVLRNQGFRVKEFSGEDTEGFTATRNTQYGPTVIQYEFMSDSDVYVTIDCATQYEADAFVESMRKAHYIRNGHLYEHPDNGYSKIYVKVNGKKITLISPYEMLPNNF